MLVNSFVGGLPEMSDFQLTPCPWCLIWPAHLLGTKREWFVWGRWQHKHHSHLIHRCFRNPRPFSKCIFLTTFCFKSVFNHLMSKIHRTCGFQQLHFPLRLSLDISFSFTSQIFPSHLDPPDNGRTGSSFIDRSLLFISEISILETAWDNSIHYQAIQKW